LALFTVDLRVIKLLGRSRIPPSMKPQIIRAAFSPAAILSLLLLASTSVRAAAPATITIHGHEPGHAISPMLYGIFFEDINCSADGGLYAELIRNRNFEDADQPIFWSSVNESGRTAALEIDKQAPVSAENLRSLKVTVSGSGNGCAGVANEGFWGMGITKGEEYDLRLFAKAAAGFRGPVTASLEAKDGTVLARQTLPPFGAEWKACSVTFKPKSTDPRARLVLSTQTDGAFWLDMVSLFPHHTWKSRPNGLRTDLAGMLSDVKPAFVRFPGGCWVEGDTMATAYRWKQTIGDVSKRRTQHNIWQYEATHGIGFLEYLQLCEDLNAEPLFVINCGMSHKEVVPLDKMNEFVQDALDAVEYANGPVTSQWGAVRAKSGHPAPFHLKYMEIGNENGGPAYYERFALFHDAIRAKYPEMHLVANDWSGTPNNRPVEIIDEHYY
jgi:Carbohydrate binding domain